MLHSTRGASMLLALLFLLFSVTVGAVVLTAAYSSAGRIARNRQEQQNYLAVASAAQLLQADLASMSLSGSFLQQDFEQIDVYETPNPDDPDNPTTWTETTTWTEYRPGGVVLTGSALLAQVVQDLETLYYSTVPQLQGKPPEDMTYPLAFDAPDLPAVTGTLTVDGDNAGNRYTITAVLKTAPDSSYATTLVFCPQVSPTLVEGIAHTEGNPSCTTTRYTASVTWDPAVLTKGAHP